MWTQVSIGFGCYGEWPSARRQRQKPANGIAAITLLFAQDFFQAYFLSTHWKTQ